MIQSSLEAWQFADRMTRDRSSFFWLWLWFWLWFHCIVFRQSRAVRVAVLNCACASCDISVLNISSKWRMSTRMIVHSSHHTTLFICMCPPTVIMSARAHASISVLSLRWRDSWRAPASPDRRAKVCLPSLKRCQVRLIFLSICLTLSVVCLSLFWFLFTKRKSLHPPTRTSISVYLPLACPSAAPSSVCCLPRVSTLGKEEFARCSGLYTHNIAFICLFGFFLDHLLSL